MNKDTWPRLTGAQRSRWLKKHWEEIPFDTLSASDRFTATTHMWQCRLTSMLIGFLLIAITPFVASVGFAALMVLFGLASTEAGN